MKVFVAGATGAVGRPLVRWLVLAGHRVTGTTRSADRCGLISELGGDPVVMDGLDPDQVYAAVRAATPQVVIHQLTGLAAMRNSRHFDRDFAATNRLRTEGLDLLLAAAVDVGGHRFIAQSFTGWPNERAGSAIKDETDPLDPEPTPESARHLPPSGIWSAQQRTGTSRAWRCDTGCCTAPTPPSRPAGNCGRTSARKLPLVGGGGGYFPFVHVEDAAAATVLAVDHGAPGVYNIVDDEPAPASTWMPYLANLLGAKRPRPIPAWLARPIAGAHCVSTMTVARGSSNAKASASWMSPRSARAGAAGSGARRDCRRSRATGLAVRAASPSRPSFAQRQGQQNDYLAARSGALGRRSANWPR